MAEAPARQKAPPVQRLEHWTLVSSDVERTKRFYTDVLGATVPNRTGPTCVDFAGILIDFFPAGGERTPSPGSGGQHHAYIIRLEDYDPWVEHFARHNVPARRTTHGLGRISIYIDDPDGYHLELTCPFENTEIGQREIEKRGLMSEVERQRNSPRPF
jgi:catechol 2,3-dioxygenase-like lactoylglutathione lyase family enzyme